MSNIQILRADITSIKADCIVNAANEQLMAGGGVCGAIFNKAGHQELQEACDKIGYCNTGDAVITPGFNLSKYIIHTVGPIYNPNNENQNKQLYNCYQKSLELAKEYGIHSIVFPLISSGIFSYPEREAWETAINSCNDFINRERSYDINIIFANQSRTTVVHGIDVLDGITIIKHQKENKDFIGFFHEYDEYGCFSNWYMSDFEYAGRKYNCVEQYFMYQKVFIFKGKKGYKILESDDPQEMKKLGKEQMVNFNSKVWDEISYEIVKRGIRAKFQQNQKLKSILLSTGDALLAECSPYDLKWGIGLSLNDPNVQNPQCWKGQNYLGRILMEVREELRNDINEYIDFFEADPIPVWNMKIGMLARNPIYRNTIRAYYLPLTKIEIDSILDVNGECTFSGLEYEMRTNMGSGIWIGGFYEMKQEIYRLYYLTHKK